MNTRKTLYEDLLPVVLGQAVCIAVMVGIFALAGYFNMRVVWGGILGGLLAIANFTVMTLCIYRAAKKAETQDIAGGQKLLHLSYTGRMIGILVALILLAKSGICNVIALALPLAFNRPILTVYAWIRKKGGAENEHER